MNMQEGKRKTKRARKVFEKTLRVNLDKEMTPKFNALKKYHGIESDTEMVRMLIQKDWREEKEKGHLEVE
jgi:hypothetical protein